MLKLLVLSVLLLASHDTSLVASAASTAACPKELQIVGQCGLQNTGRELRIAARSNPSSTPEPGRSDSSDPSTPEPKREPCKTDTALSRSCGMYGVRVTEESEHPLTIEDLAQFAPDPVTTTAEPGNVGVVGMATNFVATVAAHTASGTLLDRPVTVRFTPVRVVFDHGDGTTATAPDGGRTWSALGQAPFTATSTSHAYTRRGTYTTSTTVDYTAEVDVGGGWFPVSGELSVDGASRQIRIYEAATALVAWSCEERPAAVGC